MGQQAKSTQADDPGFSLMCPSESCRDALTKMLAPIPDVPEAMLAAIRSRPRFNTSSHHHYSSYYDAALREMVYTRDRPIFDHFGYRWESAPD